MIEETIRKIEAAIRDARAADHKDKEKLVALLELLKTELRAEAPGDAATGALKAVQTELARYEASHPGLVSAINEISAKLASLGI